MKRLIFFIFTVLLFAHDTPYSIGKFQDILNVSKLQAPKSSFDALYSVKYGDFANYSNKYFYLQDGKYMVFFMCGKKQRSELRMKKEWKTDIKKSVSLYAKVKLFPLNAKREFTFLQIHADSNLKNSINKPLLRVVWKKTYHHLKNHIWAVIRASGNIYEQNYEKIDLGSMPKNFFEIKIIIKDNKLSIKVDNEYKVSGFDVSYWKRYYNYFKAGVYLQDDGCAKALFDKLDIKGLK